MRRRSRNRPVGRGQRADPSNEVMRWLRSDPENLVEALDEASLSRFHLRAVLVSGMGFFTDAYDLFVIGIASTLVAKEWHLSSAGSPC